MGARATGGGAGSRLTADELAEARRLSKESGYRRAGGQDSGRDVQQGFAPSHFFSSILARRNRRTAATASQNAPVEPQGARSSTLERSDSPVRQNRRDRRRGSLLGGRFATTTYKTLLGA